MQYRVDFEALDWEKPMTGVRSRAIQYEGRQLRLVEYTEEMEPHWCERGHCGFILEGYFEIKFESETVLFAPGDGVFIPSGEEHKHMASVLSGPVRAVFVEDA
jgi:mannose-6-phosphate isomerase-like protein (cupin superfamily)